MNEKIKGIILNPLVSGSFFLFSGGILANLFNFIFNLLMSRNLKVEDYGNFITVVSIITLLSVPAGAFTPTIVTTAGKYFAENNVALLHSFYWKIFRILLVFGILIFIVFLYQLDFVGRFFNINNPFLLFISSIAVFLSYFISLNYTFIQSKLAFRFLSFLNTFSAFTKIAIGFSLVFLGFGLSGAAVGILFSFLLPIILANIYLRKIIFFKGNKLSTVSYKELISFGVPSAIVIFCLNAFISTDILLVKHLFNQHDAGLYAGLSLVGRVIFYITAPIGAVMFPTIVNRYAKNENHKKVLYTAVGLVTGASILVTTFYFIFPQFTIIFFLKNIEYIRVAANLGMFGIFTTLYSILSLLAYYALSIKQTKISYILTTGCILQGTLIYLFHTNFAVIINISIISVTLSIVFSLLLLYFSKNKLL